MVDELLLPVAEGVALEAADAGLEEVKTEHGNVGPGAEAGLEAESCCFPPRGVSLCTFWFSFF